MGACLSSSPAGSDSYRLGTDPSSSPADAPTPHDASFAALVRKLPALHGDIVFAVAASASADDSFFSACADGSIRHYDWQSGRVLRAYRHDKSVHRLHHTPSSGFLFSGARDTTVRQWRVPVAALPGGDGGDAETDFAAPVQVFRGHDLVVTGLATSVDSRTLATGSRDYNVCFWDVPTGAKTAVANINQNMVTALKWVPGEANLVLQTSEDLKMRIWSSTDASVVQDFPLTQYFPLDVDVSDDGRHVFASFNGFDGDGCTVALWDRRSSRVLHSLSGHEQAANSCCLLPRGADGGLFGASCSKDGTVRVWDLSRGACAATLPLAGCAALTSIRCAPSARHRDGTLNLFVGSTHASVSVLQWSPSDPAAVRLVAQTQPDSD